MRRMAMSDTLGKVDSLPDVDFIDGLELSDVQGMMLEGYTEKYSEITGEQIQLSRADPDRIILLACAQVIYQALMMVNKGGQMNLLKYAYDEYLDSLAALRGVTREPAVPAVTQMRFTLSAVRVSATSIPEGTQVTAGTDTYFATTGYAEIPAGEMDVVVPAECTEAGEAGNGFAPGEINMLVDPIAFIGSVSNTVESTGGADSEDDDSLAERAFLAPSGHSTAGPDDAYVYMVRSAGIDVGDVVVMSPSPGVVDIRVAMADGSIPDEGTIALLQDHTSQRGKRPLTDKVQIQAPDIEEFCIDMIYYINAGDQSSAEAIKKAVADAVEEYRSWQVSKIGRDINPDGLIYRVIGAGAKRVSVDQPAYREVGVSAKAGCVSVNVTYGGIEDD